MPLALGLVETKGLIAAIEAADAMAKASSVKLIGSERTNPALITIKVVGDVAAVKASVEAGAAAAARVGELVSTHIIPQPDEQIIFLFPEISDKPQVAEDIKPQRIRKSNKQVITKAEIQNTEEHLPGTQVPAEAESGINAAEDNASETVITPEPEIIVHPGVDLEKEILEEHLSESPIAPEDEYTSPGGDELERESLSIADNPVIDAHKTEDAGFYHDDENDFPEDLFSELNRTPSKKIVETKQPEEKNISLESEISRETAREILSQPLDNLNVHQLRSLARNYPDFPIKGREISKANRQELLYYFNKLR